MPLPIFATAVTSYIPRRYYVPAAFALILLALLRTYTRGRANTRLRDMHGRTVLIVGPVSPVLLLLAEHTASQQARTILLLPSGELSSPKTQSLVAAMRVVTNNEEIHAAECDLARPASVRKFVEDWMKVESGESLGDGRIDAVIFAHDFEFRPSSGELSRSVAPPDLTGAFLLTTLLLPLLLRAPSTRDIRIITFVNPFYAAAFPDFPSFLLRDSKAGDIQSTNIARGPGQREGARSLRAIIWARHLQRVLDVLASGGGASPSAAPPDASDTEAQTEERLKRRSNIVSVTVCPGFGRSETVAPYLRANGENTAWSGYLLYFILYPLIWLLVKSPENEVQTALFTLFALPAPPLIAPTTTVRPPPTNPAEKAENRVFGGELYRECQIVLPPPNVGLDWGGEAIGRMVWEGLEADLAVWEKGYEPTDKGKGEEKEEEPAKQEEKEKDDKGD